MGLEDIRNFIRFSDTLLTGGQPTEEQLAEAAEAGVQAVINLALSTSDNALPDEAAAVRSLGMEYIHIPVVWDQPQRPDLERFMDEMDSMQGQKLLVHCVMNYRVSCFVALWRYLRHGWDAGQVYDFMYQVWDPDENPAWSRFIVDCMKK
jgi:protein tyrosine phosphatase (PTP) superfamily phosphohydrolase (DUF442 family)